MVRALRKARLGSSSSLTIVAIGLLALWIVLYSGSDPATHLGSFFGSAIADWSGSVIVILGTKYLLELHSAESRPVHGRLKNLPAGGSGPVYVGTALD